jgi:hypothetical protein
VSCAAEALFESAEQSGPEKFSHEVARRFDVQILDFRDEADGIPLVFIGAGRQFHRDEVLGRGHRNPFELIVLRFGSANGVEVEGLQITPFLTRSIDEISPNSLFRDSCIHTADHELCHLGVGLVKDFENRGDADLGDSKVNVLGVLVIRLVVEPVPHRHSADQRAAGLGSVEDLQAKLSGGHWVEGRKLTGLCFAASCQGSILHGRPSLLAEVAQGRKILLQVVNLEVGRDLAETQQLPEFPERQPRQLVGLADRQSALRIQVYGQLDEKLVCRYAR